MLISRPFANLLQDYFDPSWITIERILNCDTDEENVNEKEKDPVKRYNIILDPKHPDFEQGTGRQLHVKWVNKNYSETSWEFERDLILNEVEYLEQLAAFEMRKEKPTREEMKEREDIGKTEMKRLCKVFSEKVKATEEEREKLIKKYQKDLEEKEFKNGGQLRDYQAEGVSWLMSNHINKRSSILADEMGLG
jgi:SNF2 family DNA or RNA helicase